MIVLNRYRVPVGWLLFILMVALNVKIASAATIEVGQYRAETRMLSFESRLLSFEERGIMGLNDRVNSAGSDLKSESDALASALSSLEADQTETEIRVNLSADVLFDFDKFNIKQEADEALRQVAIIITEKRTGTVTIIGHTDSKGSAGYNQKLSERRAKSVRLWLIKNGNVPEKYLLTLGMGESEPAVPNTNADGSDNPEGRKLNRRVGIAIETK